MTTCADGKSRLLRAVVAFATGDMPAVTKCLRYSGHNAARPCRFCHFAAAHDPSRKSIHCIPGDGEVELRNSQEMVEAWDKVEVSRMQGNQAQHRRFVKR